MRYQPFRLIFTNASTHNGKRGVASIHCALGRCLKNYERRITDSQNPRENNFTNGPTTLVVYASSGPRQRPKIKTRPDPTIIATSASGPRLIALPGYSSKRGEIGRCAPAAASQTSRSTQAHPPRPRAAPAINSFTIPTKRPSLGPCCRPTTPPVQSAPPRFRTSTDCNYSPLRQQVHRWRRLRRRNKETV